MLFNILPKFVINYSKNDHYKLFYEFLKELDEISFSNKEEMTIILKLTWIKERLEDIIQEKITNLSPILQNIKDRLSKDQIEILLQITKTQLYISQRNNYTVQEILENYINPMSLYQSKYLNIYKKVIVPYITLNYIYNSLLNKTHITELINNYTIQNNTLYCPTEKIYYSVSKTLNYKYNLESNNFNITTHYLTLITSIQLLFN